MKTLLFYFAQGITILGIASFLYFQYISYTASGFSGLGNGLVTFFIG